MPAAVLSEKREFRIALADDSQARGDRLEIPERGDRQLSTVEG
jgi:hypothetical protein